MITLDLDALTRPASLFLPLTGGRVQCLACAHHCKISPGNRGICQVRFNHQGNLMAPWGYVSGLQPDPIEKKPFAHLLPGSIALTYGMLGCNFHCAYCQNWFTSQILRDPASDEAVGTMMPITPQQVVKTAQRVDAKVVVSSYNEPFITAEWSREIFQQAREAGLHTGIVSNGYASPQAFRLLLPYLTAIKIDLKSMNEKTYRGLGGVLKHVLETIRMCVDAGVWVEVVTLLVPKMNDSLEELFALTRGLANFSVDIPWHVTAFHSDYKMHNSPNTSPESLVRAAEIGLEAGLKFVYAGNIPGRVESYEHTLCPGCNKAVVKRRGYRILENKIDPTGHCIFCGKAIPGIWA